MKKAIEYYRVFKLVCGNVALIKVIVDIFKFVETCHTEQRPMVTKVVLMNMGEGTKIGDFVSLWAGIGEASPIERCSHLKAQNMEYKRLLTIANERAFTEEEKKQIEMALRIFE